MLPMKKTVNPPFHPKRSRKFTTAALLAVAIGALVGQTSGQAQWSETLPYARGFLITGDYVVGAMNTATGAGTIELSGVPADADIVAAYLYWETIHDIETLPNPAAEVTFRGQHLSPGAVHASSRTLHDITAPCWGAESSVPTARLSWFRTDVLHMLEKRYDADGRWTGKYHANGTYEVTLPDAGANNNSPQSPGAGLVVVYRTLTDPLRKIVFYDGVLAKASNAPMTQKLAGFYWSAGSSAQLTHLAGSGAKNQTDRLWFGNQLLATDAFQHNGSGRSFNAVTRTVSWTPAASLPPALDSEGDAFGETATTKVEHSSLSPNECLAWGAIIFSIGVRDEDRDGLPDGLENFNGSRRDPPSVAYPQGLQLPNLNMNGRAGSDRKDVLVEMNAMVADPGTTYGSLEHPISPLPGKHQVIDEDGHDHMPDPQVLKTIANVYDKGPSGGIRIHLDVGDPQAYLNVDPSLEPFLVPAAFARGGERIKEQACTTDPESLINCQFPAYPGTVGWLLGFQLLRDAPVDDAGNQIELNPEQLQEWFNSTKRRRFDRVRNDYFRYVLYAHARGTPKSRFPCLDAEVNGNPIDYDGPNQTCAVASNPDYHIPRSVSGIADLPGGNAMVTLGLWGNFVGTPFVQASTTVHELGHNVNLWHGGAPAVFGTGVPPTPTTVDPEPNCKPNYLSIMSYLFQMHGLFDLFGNVNIDYSRKPHGALNETGLADGALTSPDGSTADYRPAWFAPADSPLAIWLGASPAKRYCSGARFEDVGAPAQPMARVQTLDDQDWTIDWDGDANTLTAQNQDVNFDSDNGQVLAGHDDWSNMRLDQIGASRNAMLVAAGSGNELLLDFGSGNELLLDFGSGNELLLDFGSGLELLLDFGSGSLLLDFGSGLLYDFGSGSELLLDFGSGSELLLDFGSGNELLLDFGSGDELLLDFGSGNELLLDFGSGDENQELDYDLAQSLGLAGPTGLTACVIGTADCSPPSNERPNHARELEWNAPTFGTVEDYLAFRTLGNAAASPHQQLATDDPITDTYFIDAEELPDGYEFTYRVRARVETSEGLEVSPASNPASIVAVNNPPDGNDDGAYEAAVGTPLVVTAADGVLANDTDDDSPTIYAMLVSGPSNGTLTLNPDGSFTYTPNAGFIGQDTFTYSPHNGTWTHPFTGAELPMNCGSAVDPDDRNCAGRPPLDVAEVTINVTLAADGFVNVDNLPPSGNKTFKPGSTVPFKWRWTLGGVAVDTSMAQPVVKIFACATSGWPSGQLVAETPFFPGNSSYQDPTAANNWTWGFNWKLEYLKDGQITPLPAGSYIVQVVSAVLGRQDPVIANNCNGTTLSGARVVVK
jgi:hypothetical protein